MSHNWKHIHSSFTLNGVSYAREELKEVAYSLVKEGQDFEKPIGDFLLDWCSDRTSIDVLTSGSTGTPKKITLQKVHMVNSAMATGKHFDLKPDECALLCLPTTSIAGKMMLVRAMVLGLRLDYVRPTSQPLEDLDKPYDFSAMVPLQAEKSLKQLHKVKTLILGGAPVSNALQKKLSSVSTNIYETYGMTETITHVAVRKIAPLREESFKLLPNIKISNDERGCLVLNAPKISNTEVVTNDLVELLGDNSFTWLGRHDNIINSGGIKLIPEQIEAKLSKVIRNRFFVAGIPDDTLSEKLVLVLEGADSSHDILEVIKSEGVLSKYEIPKAIFNLPKFLETKSGKVLRSKTLELTKS